MEEREKQPKVAQPAPEPPSSFYSTVYCRPSMLYCMLWVIRFGDEADSGFQPPYRGFRYANEHRSIATAPPASLDGRIPK